MRAPRQTWLHEAPHHPAARLALSWLAIFVVLALMVLAPFVLYLRGRAIRNRLTFEVAAMELAVERASHAMADRERALRAFLYRPDARRHDEHQRATVAARVALESARVIADTSGAEWSASVERMIALEHEWDEASQALVARAARGERDLEGDIGPRRPGPLYVEFQTVAAALAMQLDAEKGALVAQLAAADEARLAMPFVLALLGLPIVLYVGRLSRDVVRLLRVAEAEQERLARILEHMVDPVLVTDRRGHVTLANPAAQSMLGIASGTSIRALDSRLHVLDAGERSARGPVVDAIAAAQPLAIDATLRSDERGELSVSVSSAPISIAGEPVGAVTVLRDLSDRVRYEQERLKSERFQALGAMAERLAHDFGNYLEAASAATTMLERPSAADPSRRMRWVRLIRTTIDEGRNVLSGLRTLSFVSYRKPRFAPVELDAVVTRAVEIARMARPRADAVHIEQSIPAGIRIEASESDLVRALVNVLVNAVDATLAARPASEGHVEITAERGVGVVHLAIRDDGVGIPPDDHERIFDLYFTTKGERGSGMGLALAREVVTLHGGEISVESAPGAGSTFSVRLPLGSRIDAPRPELPHRMLEEASS